jgi:predicted ATPase
MMKTIWREAAPGRTEPKEKPAMEDSKREILRDLLRSVVETGAFPEVQPFRISHENRRSEINELQREGLVTVIGQRYVPTLEGVLVCDTDEARAEVAAAASAIAVLKSFYRENHAKEITPKRLGEAANIPESDAGRILTWLRGLGIWSGVDHSFQTGLFSEGWLGEAVLDIGSSDLVPPGIASGDEEGAGQRIDRLEIDGYRAFRDFKADLGDLTVIIGANATGKSSLFDFLQFVKNAVESPLPPQVDIRSSGKTLFHSGGPERISWGITLDVGQRVPLRFEVEIIGPVGSPRVARERLATARPVRDGEPDPFVLIDADSRRSVVRDQRGSVLYREEWPVQANELVLRQVRDPRLATIPRVRDAISRWRFYSGIDLDTSIQAAMRRPAPPGTAPILDRDGSNLGAVLLWMQTEHREAWKELESTLGSAVPGFLSLNPKPAGGDSLLFHWREAGVAGELTLADLSDGTLRLLCWAAVCLDPDPPTLLCIDEPELGLHPRVLPIVAGLLRLASARTQILVATHSPHFLSAFALDEIAVMRKEGGAARMARPASSSALRSMVEEIGGEALIRLHLSDELEVLP